jgi:hypothetical protein
MYPSSTHGRSVSKIAWNIQSHSLTQCHQYWPNLFHSTNKSLDNILMGEMVDGFDGVWRWRLLDSDRLHNVQKLAKVNIGIAWWT